MSRPPRSHCDVMSELRQPCKSVMYKHGNPVNRRTTHYWCPPPPNEGSMVPYRVDHLVTIPPLAIRQETCRFGRAVHGGISSTGQEVGLVPKCPQASCTYARRVGTTYQRTMRIDRISDPMFPCLGVVRVFGVFTT
jgi:hypothetical protein